MGVVGKGFQKGKPEEGEALLTVVPFVKEAAIMKRSIGVAFSMRRSDRRAASAVSLLKVLTRQYCRSPG